MLIPIRDVGKIGVVNDIPSHRLPANAWSDARGVRFYDNAVWKAYGQTAVLGTPTVDPYYLYLHIGPANTYWVYPGLAKVYATDGTTHSDITKAAFSHTGAANDLWSGCHLGGIEIFNNGVDTPQAWINPTLSTLLIDLANWPASTSARVLKSFKQYLIAANVTKSGTHYPHLVKWSHVADIGSVPSSWDETSATNDAGEYPLAETGGHILEMRQMGNVMIIYKEEQTWIQSYIGGRFIFKFDRKFQTGIVNARCVKEYKAKHIVALQEDIIIHDGFNQESLLDDRMRRWYAGQVDPTFSLRQYMAINERENEIWMCLPRAGQEHPSIALIINMKDGTQTLRDLPNPTFITEAPIDPAAGLTTFDSQTIPFDQMQGVFGQRQSKPGTRRLVGAHRLGTARFLLYDEGLNDEGSNFRGYVERQSMPLAGVDRYGQPILDPRGIVQVNEIWPEIRQVNGSTVDIYVGGQDTLNESITWEGPFPFTVGVDDKIDCQTTGRYLSFRFETTDQSQWKLDGYSVNIEPLGQQ